MQVGLEISKKEVMGSCRKKHFHGKLKRMPKQWKKNISIGCDNSIGSFYKGIRSGWWFGRKEIKRDIRQKKSSAELMRNEYKCV